MKKNKILQNLIQEEKLSPASLVMPFFVKEGKNEKIPITSMPGNYQVSIDNLIPEAQALAGSGIKAMLLFGIPGAKDEAASGAYAEEGIIQRALRALREKVPELMVITDICLCAYTGHGHCGIIKNPSEKIPQIDKEATLEVLVKIALAQAEAGAEMIAPSAMVSGQVGAIRSNLDQHNYQHVSIMAYSAKYASALYAPFREAVESAPAFGDRSSYQLAIADSEAALGRVASDIQEGADIVMVKPALGYLDIIHQVKKEFNHPLAAYNVSGEFALVKAAAEKGWIEEKPVVLEQLAGLKRAGADIIITYWARDAAHWLGEKQ